MYISGTLTKINKRWETTIRLEGCPWTTLPVRVTLNFDLPV